MLYTYVSLYMWDCVGGEPRQLCHNFLLYVHESVVHVSLLISCTHSGKKLKPQRVYTMAIPTSIHVIYCDPRNGGWAGIIE